MSKKSRTQYNWKFKENESKEFIEWFENQDNISNSLRSVLYHIIDLYGKEDFLDPTVQRQVYKNTFTLESLKNNSQSNHNFDLIDLQQQGEDKTDFPPVKQSVVTDPAEPKQQPVKQPVEEIKEENIKPDNNTKSEVSQNRSEDSKVKNKDIYGNVNQDLI
jgi:hypothetical protein